ncbi:MAG: M56 family metallopeptidase [Planctomycetota bacterium]
MSGLELAGAPALGAQVTTWFVTYLLHSTLLLGAAWVSARWITAPRRRELVWRAALLGGLVTASAQLVLDVRPTFGPICFGQRAAALDATEPTGAGAAAALDALLAQDQVSLHRAQPSNPQQPGLLAPARARWASLQAALEGRLVGDLRHVGPTALTLGALFASASVACGLIVLSRRRRCQTRVTSGPLARLHAELAAGSRRLAQIELWLCPRSDTPYAAGQWRPRIVVPRRALTDLCEDEQRAMLAHELAHIERRDPLWLGLTRALQLCLPLQPLNTVARRQLAACAELLCDERAIERTHDRLALAQSLAKVAGWLTREDELPDAACPMANHRSLLGTRVARILDEEAVATAGVQPLRVTLALALAGTALAAPTVELGLANGDLGAALMRDDARGVSDADAVTSADLVARTGSANDAEAGALPAAVRSELNLLADALDMAVAELEDELAGLDEARNGRALAPDLAARVEAMEQRAGEVRARAKRIRALLARAASGGVEAPQGGRNRAAAPSIPPRAR